MNWLQWSNIDLEHGLGGVEVHARSLARELKSLGVDVFFSSDIRDFYEQKWDVVHTHGSSYPLLNNLSLNQFQKQVRVHTLHGTTLGRMKACGEWFWLGGYAAYMREIEAVKSSHVILSVRPGLQIPFLKKRAHQVCGNGWDSASDSDIDAKISDTKFQKHKPFWTFIGRGDDIVKGADRLEATLSLLPDIQFLAAPGNGFKDCPQIIKTGRLSSQEVFALLNLSDGLILPSRYEGNSLVVLEALANGVVVVTTKVGAVPYMPKEIQGMVVCDSADPRSMADAIRAAQRFPNDPQARNQRALINRKLLPTWKNVAQCALKAIEEYRKA